MQEGEFKIEKSLRQTFDEILKKKSKEDNIIPVDEVLKVLCMVYENTEKIKEKLGIS